MKEDGGKIILLILYKKSSNTQIYYSIGMPREESVYLRKLEKAFYESTRMESLSVN
jgi:hypothetical protein